MAAVIYLHWTATGYDWIRPGHYHSIIGGDGRVHRLHVYSVDLPGHTYGRNRNSVALSCACMGGNRNLPFDERQPVNHPVASMPPARRPTN